MDMDTIGMWAWRIGLALLVLWGLLGGLGVALDIPIVAELATLLAFVGGILYLGKMEDKTGFFVAALALGAFSAGAGMLFVDILGNLVAGILGGAAVGAGAGAAGALVMVVWGWLMPKM
ncbi:MAG: hypothetical protein ACRDFQ_02345 [Anaerolineales bacterium]